MSRRGFRLSAVERLRSARLDETGQALARARRELALEAARRAELQGHLALCVPGARETPTGVQVAAYHRELLRERLVASDARAEQLRQQAEVARTRWLAARADLQAVEMLRERYRAAVRREQDRRDQRAMDDLASSRHRPPPDPSAPDADRGPDRGPDDAGPGNAGPDNGKHGNGGGGGAA